VITTYEGHGQTVTLTDQERGYNFRWDCTCGRNCGIASLDRGFAEKSARQHLDSHRELTADEIFEMLK
jgi:hypothetical protein